MELKHEQERIERKLKDTRLEAKTEHIMKEQGEEFNRPSLSKKEESILPIKLLFLKYFDPSSNYETKLKAFSTLC